MEEQDWFIDPEITRLELSGGQWLDVKKQLTAGDTRKMFTDLVKQMEAGKAAVLDREKVGVSKILNIVVDWSLRRRGKKVPFTEAALLTLAPKRYQEISDAVEKHEAAMEAARETEKNGLDGGIDSSTTLPSVA